MTQRLAAAATLFLCLGCGGADGPKLYTVTGTVTFAGEPVEDGRITFRNIGGDGKAFSGPITAGKYSVEAEAGQMSVDVTASKLIPGKYDYSNGTKEQMGKMYIPAKYNSATTLKAAVTSDTTTFDFPLTEK